MKKEIYKEITIETWEKLIEYNKRLLKTSPLWAFRGQKKYEWDLKSSLERAMEDYEEKNRTTKQIELGLLRRFKRQYFHYGNYIPADDDYILWLSIMQHYGCPTRLLDFSYSIFVALFFAIEDISFYDDKIKKCNHYESCIWAIKSKWLKENIKKEQS